MHAPRVPPTPAPAPLLPQQRRSCLHSSTPVHATHAVQDRRDAGIPVRPERSRAPLTAFWRDYAEWLLAAQGGEAAAPPFLSANLHTAPLDLMTAAVAAGLLERTFRAGTRGEKPPEHSMRYDGASMHWTAAAPAVAFLQETTALEVGEDVDREAGAAGAEAASARSTQQQLLGHVCVVDPTCDTRRDEETGEDAVAPAALPLLRGRVYALDLVLSNPSPATAAYEVVVPLPEGAMPVVNVKADECAPFACARARHLFYFPSCGSFRAPSVSVARRGCPLQALHLPRATHTLQVRRTPAHTACIHCMHVRAGTPRARAGGGGAARGCGGRGGGAGDGRVASQCGRER
jgi:hypothetical protein